MRNGIQLDHVEAAAVLVGASALCSVLVQRSFTQQSELPSEIVCWMILPYLSKIAKSLGSDITEHSYTSDNRSDPLKSTWIIAAGLTISSLYKAENGLVELSVRTRIETDK